MNTKNIFEKTGHIALSSRLRVFTSQLTDEAQKIFDLYEVQLSPNWFLVFYILSDGSKKTITQIAEEIKHSQPSVTKIIKEMKISGLVTTNITSVDKRANVVALSKSGLEISEKIKPVLVDLNLAIENVQAEANTNLWEALNEWEFLFDQKSLLKRVKEQKQLRESKEVQIVQYDAKYQTAFKSLNEEWITKYFKMEDVDYEELNNPEDYVIDKGGEILIAIWNNEPVGVCAMVKLNDPICQFELSKLAVSPVAQGKGVGKLLVKAVIQLAKTKGSSKLFLQSNTILGPAINLYYNMGFKKVSRPLPLYARVNIQMELDLNGK